MATEIDVFSSSDIDLLKITAEYFALLVWRHDLQPNDKLDERLHRRFDVLNISAYFAYVLYNEKDRGTKLRKNKRTIYYIAIRSITKQCVSR